MMLVGKPSEALLEKMGSDEVPRVAQGVALLVVFPSLANLPPA
jgi:hypothetical protein